MSVRYLSFKFDIHGGGLDLIFPHHENEIAQSCAACQESDVSYWMHNRHVTNNNEKMSKSLGNFFTIRQITERYHPLALRYFLIKCALPFSSQLLCCAAGRCIRSYFLYIPGLKLISLLLIFYLAIGICWSEFRFLGTDSDLAF